MQTASPMLKEADCYLKVAKWVTKIVKCKSYAKVTKGQLDDGSKIKLAS